MIYINKNTTTVLVPRTNFTDIQNRIVVTNQISNYTYEYHLDDISTDSDYYEYVKPSFDVNRYAGSYDYKIMCDDIILASGIVVVEGEGSDGDVTDKIEYQYQNKYTIQYTPSVDYYPVVERVKDIQDNGTFNVENYDKIDVDVPSTKTVEITLAAYNALPIKDNNTIYLING